MVVEGEPALRGSAQGLGEAQRHLWADPGRAVQDAVEGGGGHGQLDRELPGDQPVRFQVDLADELPSVRGIVHGHQW